MNVRNWAEPMTQEAMYIFGQVGITLGNTFPEGNRE